MYHLKRVGQLVVSIGVSFLAGGLGALATTPNIPSWYAGLDKPPFLPPNEIFGPVWTLLYLLMGIALFLVWIKDKKINAATTYTAFGAQLLLNLLWSIVFFGLHLPWIGVLVIVSLIASIIWTISEFSKYSKAAMWLLMPYLAWVCFATYLTLGVAFLN
jgi:tryptophan-rich sensory protein